MDLATEPRPHEAAAPIDFTPTLPNAIRRATERFGDALYMIDGERRITFAEAERQSAALARGFLAMGLGRGSRVGVQMPNNADWVLCWFALARIGALPVALSTLYQRREEAWALRHNDLDTLLVSARYLSHDYQARLEEAVPGLAEQSRDRPFYLASHPYLRRVIVWGDKGEIRPWAMHGPDAVLARAEATPQIDAAFLRQVEDATTPADDLIVICTSGTTAEPKAVIETHGQGIRNVWNYRAYTDLQAGDRLYQGLQFFWIGGLLLAVLPALYVGACMVMPKPGDDLLDLILRERINVVVPNAADAHAIRVAAAARKPDLSFVRRGLTPFSHRGTGEILAADRKVGGALGMTETFGSHSADAFDLPTPAGKGGTWGRPMPGVERRIVSLETREPLPPGEVGELQLRGRTLMRGYLKRERHEAFDPDGWFSTGDRCMLDADGFLYFYGRANEMIKTSGANVAPAEVEAVLVSYPEIREAIVFGVKDAARGQAVAAVVVPEDGFEIDGAALRAKVRKDISTYKVPQVILAMGYHEVPRTDGSSKPKKPVLREMVEQGRESSPDFGI